MDESLPHLLYGKGCRESGKLGIFEMLSAVRLHQGRGQQAEWEFQRLRGCFSRLKHSSYVSFGFLDMAELIPRDPCFRVAKFNLALFEVLRMSGGSGLAPSRYRAQESS